MKIFKECRIRFINRKGMTLVEVILAIAILGIISTAFIAMFGNGLKTISFAGNKSRAAFSAQSDVDKKILNSSGVGMDTINVDFYDVANPVSGDSYEMIAATGHIIQGTATIGGKNSVMETFIP